MAKIHYGIPEDGWAELAARYTHGSSEEKDVRQTESLFSFQAPKMAPGVLWYFPRCCPLADEAVW